MKSRFLVAVMLVLVTLSSAGWFLFGYLSRASFFQVRQIDIEGLHYLNAEEMVIALGLTTPRSIFASLDSIEARAASLPGVSHLTMQRRFPGAISIRVQEEQPVALALHGNHLVLVNRDNQPLPFDPARVNRSYPIADTLPGTTDLLSRILAADPAWYEQIDYARGKGDYVVLQLGADRHISLRSDSDPVTLDGVRAVGRYLSEEGITWLEIDGRYSGRVFVKPDRRKGLM